MYALLLAVALVAAPPATLDTVFLADGGRVRGTIVEERPAAGVTIVLPDGTTRRLEVREVLQVQYADGTVSVPQRAQPPAPATSTVVPVPQAIAPAAPAPTVAPAPPPAAPAAPAPAPAPRSSRTAPAAAAPAPDAAEDDWDRDDWASAPPDRGERWPAPPPAPAPRPYAPVPVTPAADPPLPLYLVLGAGWSGATGSAEPGVSMSSMYGSATLVTAELGARIAEHFLLGLYVEAGGGDAGSAARAACTAQGLVCESSVLVRLGLAARWAFAPRAEWNPWLGIGIGAEAGGVYDQNGDDVVSYAGREAPRLMAGLDFRASRFIGIGPYASLSFSRYSETQRAGSPDAMMLGARASHAWGSLGIRAVLFP